MPRSPPSPWSGCSIPAGGYNPFLQMLSALGEIEVRGVRNPACHYWFMAGMFLSAASVGLVWCALVRRNRGWRRICIALGGAVDSAGLCTIAVVSFDVNGTIHNIGCTLAVAGGAAVSDEMHHVDRQIRDAFRLVVVGRADDVSDSKVSGKLGD